MVRHSQLWRWTTTGIVLAVALYVALLNSQQRPSLPTTAKHREPTATAEALPEAATRTQIPGQMIRDLEGRVVFRGEVDVQQTLARIESGERLDFPNDGSIFQNRERRLPRRPPGHYREYVHPTPGLRGPGPQRLVIGEQGEIYYTPDHYRTFQRLDE